MTARRSPLAGLVSLLRLRLLPSALADPIAGAALAGGVARADLPAVLRTVVASGCLYAGGIALADVADVARDRRLGRDRPIAAGRVDRGSAAVLGGALVALGVLAAPGPVRPLAAALAALILVYDFAAKRTPATAAPVLGLCRAANLAMGCYLVPGVAAALPAAWLGPAMMYAVFTAGIVVHGELEDHPPRVGRSTAVLSLTAGAGAGVAAFLPRPGLALLASLPTLWLAVRAPRDGPDRIRARTGILLRGLPRFTFALALGAGAWLEATILAVPAWVLPLVVRPRSWT